MRVAIIGTRAPHISIVELTRRFEECIPPSAIVHSGNAEGVDQISKHWEKNIQYLPWEGYGAHGGIWRSTVAGNTEQFDRLISDLFSWVPLSSGGAAGKDALKKFVRRNCAIVLGLDPTGRAKVDAVYFYARETAGPLGKVSGGTAYGVAVARNAGIPTYNLWKDEDDDN